MKISNVSVKNFRTIGSAGVNFTPQALTFLIGDNGTAKTTILEAINFCLSPSYLAGKIGHADFHNGADDEIEIIVKLDTNFSVSLLDGYQERAVVCDGVVLKAHKRDRAAAGKAFSDVVVVDHYALPVAPRGASGWSIARASGRPFEFDERRLAFPLNTSDLPRVFYFGKNRERQLQKGYNSTFSSIIDDLNWRFAKNNRAKDPADRFHHKKTEFEGYITSNTDGDTLTKTVSALNAKLVALGLDEIDLAFIDGSSPYDSSFISKAAGEANLPVDHLGSGIEMITSILFLDTAAALSREKIIVLIDEPELHMHPELQEKTASYFLSRCSDIQLIASTHSPYTFRDIVAKTGVSLQVATKDAAGEVAINPAGPGGIFPWSPSWAEVNYNAFGLATFDFHNELYGFIQEKESKFTEASMESHLVSKGCSQKKTWIKVSGGAAQPGYAVTLMTYVRNSIHHPENRHNPAFTHAELEASIREMLGVL